MKYRLICKNKIIWSESTPLSQALGSVLLLNGLNCGLFQISSGLNSSTLLCNSTQQYPVVPDEKKSQDINLKKVL